MPAYEDIRAQHRQARSDLEKAASFFKARGVEFQKEIPQLKEERGKMQKMKESLQRELAELTQVLDSVAQLEQMANNIENDVVGMLL